MGSTDARTVALVAGLASSMLLDFAVRVAPKSTISGSTLGRLPAVTAEPYAQEIILRSLRLNCLTSAYAPLWEDVMKEPWSPDSPFRVPMDRRIAMLEIDVVIAIALGVTADEMVAIYRTQFPVLAGYDRAQYAFDANGRLVPSTVIAAWRRAKKELALEERSVTHPGSQITYVYDPPFRFLDREVDLRAAYEEFERRLATN